MKGPNGKKTDADKMPEQSDGDSGKPAPLSELQKVLYNNGLGNQSLKQT